MVTFVLAGILVFLFSLQMEELLDLYPLQDMKKVLHLAASYNNELFQHGGASDKSLEEELKFLDEQQEYLWLLDTLQTRIKRKMVLSLSLTSLIFLGGAVILMVLFVRTISRPLDKIFSSLGVYAKMNRVQFITSESGRASGLVTVYNKLLYDLDRARKQIQTEERFASRQTGQVMIIHEMKNSLSPLTLSLESLLMESQGAIKKGLEDILGHLCHTEQVLNQFRSVTSIKKPELDWISIEEVLRSVVSSLETSFPFINFSLEGRDFKILSDRTYLGIILMNILRNGAEAISGKGEVLAVFFARDRILEITDTGDGIKKNDIKQIFKPGYTTKKSGSGQGLFLVNELCSLLNIKMGVSSQKGETVFKMEFGDE